MMRKLWPFFLSPVALSCLYTMGVAAKSGHGSRQAVPDRPLIPPEDVCKLRAQLILEEALETISALGFNVVADGHANVTLEGAALVPSGNLDWEKAVDGCCDSIYVATGAMLALGAPDVPHLKAVCDANDAKFPGGRAIIDQATGKYLKPFGWEAPDHTAPGRTFSINLRQIQEDLLAAKEAAK
jgi:predicted HAD superfamily Cof-like phosphohydrolase